MEKSKVKKNALFVFYGLVTVLILVAILSANDIGEINKVLLGADWRYTLIAIGLLLVYALLSPLTLCLLSRCAKTRTSFGMSYAIGMTEHFFNGITPFSTGGQPFQIYAFSKAKVNPTDSTGTLFMNFIIHMIVTNGFAICSLVYYDKFASQPGMNVVAIIGFSINFAVLLFMIALATSRRIREFLMKIVVGLSKVKWLSRFVTPLIPVADNYFTQTQKAFKDLWQHKGTFITCILIKIPTMAIYYAITFYILKALHIDVGYNDLFFVICGTSFAITMVVFVPTPGSSGGIEFAFKSIFVSLAGVSSTVAYSGMLLWRLLTYYFLMFVSLLFFIGIEIYFGRKRKKEEALNTACDNNAVNTDGSNCSDSPDDRAVTGDADSVLSGTNDMESDNTDADENNIEDSVKADNDIDDVADSNDNNEEDNSKITT